MLQRPESTSRQQPQKEKLRKACNECTVAKVKCSGQKTGCDRCKNQSTECIYEKSRVGKVSGIRLKSNRLLENPSGSRGFDLTAAHPNRNQQHLNPALTAPATTSTRSQMADADFGDMGSNWPPLHHGSNQSTGELPGVPDLFGGTFDIDEMPPITSTRGSRTNTATTSDRGMSSFSASGGFDFDSVNASSSATSDMTTEFNGPPSQARSILLSDSGLNLSRGGQTNLKKAPAPNVDYRCVLAMCQMIGSLEGYIDASIRPIDLVLSVVKKTVNQISHILNLQQNKSSPRFLHLFMVLMYQMLDLLETGVASFVANSTLLADESIFQLDAPAGLVSTDFAFGSFQMDSSAQRRWRANIVRQELQQVNEIHQRIVAMSKMSNTNPQLIAEQLVCHKDMQRRLAALRDHVERVEQQ